MALFPAHNPNPVIELDTEMKIIYHNEACRNHPSIYKLINESHDELSKFQYLLKKTIKSKKDGKYTVKEGVKIDNKHYAFNFYIDKKHNFIRLYLTDMTESIQLQEELKKQRDEIYDSLNYAKIIQESILPDVEIFQHFFESQFFLYNPKDIVSGDFYWATKKNDKLFFALCDCTGHGVPGSLLSMIGYDALNYINSLESVNGGADFMNKLNDFLVQSRAQGRMRFNDTMDMILFMYDPQSKMFCFSGSKQKVIIIRNKEILEFNTDHFNLGDDFGHTKSSFSEEKLTLKKNDIIYLFTDGYVDQFGGDSGKKLKYPRFRKLLLDICKNPLDEQKKLLEDFLENWKAENINDPFDQLDDISVIGFKV
ncbi:MAG: SpoIIE family protein phosphatase [Bacteroidota bacterium]|nr:SpoIIE family protein phosphatase [Bacteroidota bacterium]